MEVTQSIDLIKKVLTDDTDSAERKLERISRFLPSEYRYKFISHKDLLLDSAKESGRTRFRLIATMNSNISIFFWCDEQQNFIGMCPSLNAELEGKYSNGIHHIDNLS